MTTQETITVRLEKNVGYTGKRSGKSYIARITGACQQYIFAREFVESEPVDLAAMFSARRKRKGSWVEAAALEVGLYEISRAGDREYLCVWMDDALPGHDVHVRPHRRYRRGHSQAGPSGGMRTG